MKESETIPGMITRYESRVFDKAGRILDDLCDLYEVIGNIFENPELLK